MWEMIDASDVWIFLELFSCGTENMNATHIQIIEINFAVYAYCCDKNNNCYTDSRKQPKANSEKWQNVSCLCDNSNEFHQHKKEQENLSRIARECHKFGEIFVKSANHVHPSGIKTSMTKHK